MLVLDKKKMQRSTNWDEMKQKRREFEFKNK